eukprot:m.8614 g.8614  ORF g.8614 m.8614 type:complete len:76 (+) comp3199_c0_seq1:320-547(+)
MPFVFDATTFSATSTLHYFHQRHHNNHLECHKPNHFPTSTITMASPSTITTNYDWVWQAKDQPRRYSVSVGMDET